MIPVGSRVPTADPRTTSEFTLNQFNMVVSLDKEAHDVSQVHFYPHNDALVEALPAPLKTRLGDPIAAQILRRLTVGLGYLPSWESPAMHIRISEPHSKGACRTWGVWRQQNALANPMFGRWSGACSRRRRN